MPGSVALQCCYQIARIALPYPQRLVIASTRQQPFVWVKGDRSHSVIMLREYFENSSFIWNPDEGRVLKVLSQHNHGVRSVAFHPHERLLASGGDDQTLRIWESDTGYLITTLQGYTPRHWSIA